MNFKSHNAPFTGKLDGEGRPLASRRVAGNAVMTLAIAAAGVVVMASSCLNAAAQSLPRVISINTCTDQLALAFAAPSQVLGLSRFSRDVEMSFLAGKAIDFPRLRGVAEEILKLKPDFVLAGTFSGRATRYVLSANGIHVETFSPPRSIEEAKAEIVRGARLFGHPERGTRLTDEIEQMRARIVREARKRRPLTVLAVQRRTFVSGRLTLISDVLETAGFKNLAAQLGIENVGQVSLEVLIKVRPDVLVLERLDGAPDQSTAVLHHPVLARAYPPIRRIIVPVAEATCAGPALIALMHRIEEAAARLSRS